MSVILEYTFFFTYQMTLFQIKFIYLFLYLLLSLVYLVYLVWFWFSGFIWFWFGLVLFGLVLVFGFLYGFGLVLVPGFLYGLVMVCIFLNGLVLVLQKTEPFKPIRNPNNNKG
jgi:hypothetical protein